MATSTTGSILVLSSANLDNVTQIKQFYPSANVSTVPGPNNAPIPNPFPEIPSSLPATSYYTRLGNREKLVALRHDRDTLQNELETLVATMPGANTTLLLDSISSLNAQIASVEQNSTLDVSYLQTVGNATVKDFFEVRGPPPTEMTLQIDTRFLNLHVSTFNNEVKVYLTQYLLNAVWRDGVIPVGPGGTLTANAGTSTSQRLRVYLYAGNPSSRESVRLLKTPIFRDGGVNDPDFIIHRNQAHIYEKSHNPYHPNIDLSSDLYFENHYVQQTQRYDDPGFFLGVIDPQAIRSLQTTREISLRWETDRSPDFPSPFWDSRYLRGSSVWNPITTEFEVQEPGFRSNVYFQRANTVSLAVDVQSGETMTGGPYFPLSLYTLQNPLNQSVAPFMNDSTFDGEVTDPLDGEICPLNHAQVTLQLSQMAIRGTTDLAQVNTRNIPALAPSDQDSFAVPVYDAATGDIDMLTVHQRSSTQVPPRYALDGKSSIQFPNGAWKGSPMVSANTAVSGWKSPFPWEQGLTQDQLAVANESVAYSGSMSGQILNVGDYLFLDPGTSWNEHDGNVTVGERSLQFDFGLERHAFINKCQLLFPRSQEDHQPYRLEASMLKAYGGSADVVVRDAKEAFWFGGVQVGQLSGSELQADKYRFLNTHTQTSTGLDTSYTQLWDVLPRQIGTSFVSPSSAVAAGAYPPAISIEETRGRANVVTVPVTIPATVGGWYNKSPNAENPVLDFQRQEFGPFVRGCTMTDLKNSATCKAWSTNNEADPAPILGGGGRFFYNLVDYMSSAAGSAQLGHRMYMKKYVDEWVETDSAVSTWIATASSTRGDRFAAVGPHVHTFYEGVWTQRTTTPQAHTSITSSGDGMTLMTCVQFGDVLLSSDFGVTWNAVANSSLQNWADVVLAEDGLTGLAVAYNGHVWRYASPGGLLSIKLDLSLSGHTWVDVAMSQSGQIAAAVTLDRVYASRNFGSTFFTFSPPGGLSTVDINNPWKSVAVNSNGTRIVAVPTYGRVLQLTHSSMGGFGAWSVLPGSPTARWQHVTFVGGTIKAITAGGAVVTYLGGSTWDGPVNEFDAVQAKVDMASSADGSKAIASVYGGGVFLSSDNGITWTKTDLENASWSAAAMSSDGSHAAAVVENGYVYVYSDTTGWKEIQDIGRKRWSAVSMSNDGTFMYATVYDGYVYASSDFGITWSRDVSPASYETWVGIAIHGIGTGFAITESGRLFQVDVGGQSPYQGGLTAQTLTLGPQQWQSVDSSDDGGVAVAVCYPAGELYTSRDGGESWQMASSAGIHDWASVAVSADGRKRIAVAQDGHVAISMADGLYASSSLDQWSVMTTSVIYWSSVQCSDDFSLLIATEWNAVQNGFGQVYVSIDEGQTWTPDARLTVNAQWTNVSLSRDGLRALAAPIGGKLYMLTSGDTWYLLQNTPRPTELAESNGPKVLTVDASSLTVPFFMDSEFSSYVDRLDTTTLTTTTVYEYFSDQYNLYLVDCRREIADPGDILDGSINKLVQLADGEVSFQSGDLIDFLMQEFVQNGAGTADDYAVIAIKENKTYLAYQNPWVAPGAEYSTLLRSVLLDDTYVKKVLPHSFTPSKTSVAMLLGPQYSNHEVDIEWRGIPQTLVLPSGTYTVATLNAAFQLLMKDAGHYLENTIDGSEMHFMSFVEIDTGVQLRIDPIPYDGQYPAGWQPPPANVGSWPYLSTEPPPLILIVGETPAVIKKFGDLIGFMPGDYRPESSVVVYTKDSDFLPVVPTGAGPQWITHDQVLYPPIRTFEGLEDLGIAVDRAVGTLSPVEDYIVKEAFFFAPGYDQYDTKQSKMIDGVQVFQPRNSALPQKVVNPFVGVGRYFGVAFGSFLYDKQNQGSNEVYTRGAGNLMKLYSFRPLTQLFSFETTSGVIKDRSGGATSLATFKNVVTKGILGNVAIQEVGTKYASKDTTQAFIHPTILDTEEGMYYDSSTGTFADTPMYLLEGTTNELVSRASGGSLSEPRHAQVSYTMSEDTVSEPRIVYRASDKTPLRRMAEFHLRIISS